MIEKTIGGATGKGEGNKAGKLPDNAFQTLKSKLPLDDRMQNPQVDFVVTRGVASCTVVILSNDSTNEYYIMHLDGKDLNAGLEFIKKVDSEEWNGSGGITSITISYKDDKGHKDDKNALCEERHNFVSNLKESTPNAHINILRRKQENPTASHAMHAEIGLAIDNGEVVVHGDLINPKLDDAKYEKTLSELTSGIDCVTFSFPHQGNILEHTKQFTELPNLESWGVSTEQCEVRCPISLNDLTEGTQQQNNKKYESQQLVMPNDYGVRLNSPGKSQKSQGGHLL